MPCAACGNKQSSYSNSTQRNSTFFLQRRRVNSRQSFQRASPYLKTNVPPPPPPKVSSQKNNVMILGTLK